MPQTFQAIAAMSENRVIGNGNAIPWHLPEDFKWFKATTIGHIIVMGRKTFDSIGRPLPKRETFVLSRSAEAIPGTTVIRSLDELPQDDERTIFICGGAEIYGLALPQCSDLFMTHVKRTVEGDTFFPAFEDDFEAVETVADNDDFLIVHYRRKGA